MIVIVRRLVLAAIIIVVLETGAFAVPAVPGTLQDYIDLGSGGATIGSVLFADFTLLELPTGATPILPQNILVTPISSPSNPGFLISVNQTAAAGELFEVLIGYNVSGTSFAGNTLSMEGSSVTPDGAVTGVEDLWLGEPFDLNLAGSTETLIVFDIGILADTSEQLSFAPVNLIGVVTDIAVDGGLAGTGALGSVTNQFQVNAVPEPATMTLVTLGLCGLGAFKARKRHA
jgi:hypothetical protein